ncbi:MAG: hypothetical protein HY587_04270 [Candidatus Omnitrophica bacterium]|nr:hypothetical protein [Candidatus Omnitrophota bacterium]
MRTCDLNVVIARARSARSNLSARGLLRRPAGLLVMTAGLLVIVFTLPASAGAPKDEAWEKYVSSYKKLQVAFHDLVRLHQPELGEAIDQSLELGLAMMDERSEQFYHLLKNQPERIVHDAGFRAFINFAWLHEDDEALREKSRSYKKIQKRIEELKAKTDTNEQFPKIQEELRRMENDQRYMEVVARFRFVSEEVEKLLAGQQVS